MVKSGELLRRRRRSRKRRRRRRNRRGRRGSEGRRRGRSKKGAEGRRWLQKRRRRIRDSRRATVFTLGGWRTPSVISETRSRLYLALSPPPPSLSFGLSSPFARFARCSFLRDVSLYRDLSSFLSISLPLPFSLESTISRSYSARSLLFSKQERGVSFMRKDRSVCRSRNAPTERAGR